MKLNKQTIFGGAALASIVLIAGAVSVASAAVQTNGSDGPIYFAYGDTGAFISDSASNAWAGNFTASSSGSNAALPAITCPAESTGVSGFLAPAGSERTKASWSAYKADAFVSGTKNVFLPDLSPTAMINGTPGQAAVKASGGNYSLGLACTTNNGVTVVGAFYRSISITAGTGAFTFAATSDVVSTPAPTAVTTGTIALSATTVAAVNGPLSLSVPAGATATFGAPTLVNNRSTTTGTLPNITVSDGRVNTPLGWTLTATVNNFVNSADATNTISNTNLGIAPAVVAGSTTATGVTAGAAATAGSATYGRTFAEAAAGNIVGDTVLNGALTFVAPQNKVAGTYTSTLTLTLVSK
ncbi:hypothetical protein M2116_000634 [Aurantimicrobium minutum]|uniref:hypothetical protein n=1 Tax=Aurantimicrobium minutum TaxID=708131 RepID=UPI002404C668|nr:hypothetical protein [Aurantimicrobium minutum]MDF9809690.1 hypothetical protein [Aurantimicrobium minutum]